MAYETKDNSGSVFPNKEKKSDNHPDYSGSVRIDGKDYWLSGWRKISEKGTAWLSLAFKAKDGTAARPASTEQEFKTEVAKHFNMDDEVPF